MCPAPAGIACRPKKSRASVLAGSRQTIASEPWSFATSRGRGRDRSSSHGRRRQMSAPPLTEPPRETTALSPLADRSSSGRRAPLERQRGGHFAARRHPRHGGANPRRPAIRGTRTCIWRTDRSGPSPRGSSDTCSRRRPSRRSFWAGGLPRRLRRCVGPPAGRAGGRR
jgi:hypothetical protein